MLIPQFYKDNSRPIISFEIFPPKTDKGMENLQIVIPELISLRPDFMTVTYGALGSTQERTLEIASTIKNDFKMETACHLTCVGASITELDHIIKRIYEANIRNIVALRGDPPHGEETFVPPTDGLSHAHELVKHIRKFEEKEEIERFGIAVAGYPEKHLEAESMERDIANLGLKIEAGADVIITQLFFENKFFLNFVKQVREAGINVPIIPGLMPILSVRQIQHITSMCGSRIPQKLQSELKLAVDDDERAQEIGIRQCISQANDLIANGAKGIHFYVLNKTTHIRQIMEAIRS
jgi:methylenetetrahydrofolate reductase (NADPH)